MNRLRKWLYRWGVLRPYDRVDIPRYLKRLRQGRGGVGDPWYVSEKDASQDGGGEVLVKGRLRQTIFWLYCDPAIPVEMKTLRGRGCYDLQALELMVDMAPPGSLLLDIGGNIGAIAIPVALARPDLTLHSFEPNPHASRRFRRNLGLNPQAGNLRLWDLALGAACGREPFHAYQGVNLGDGSFIACPRAQVEEETIAVEVATLDSLFPDGQERLGLVKMDVQGYESRVLAGARRLIGRHRPFILLEHEDLNFGHAAAATQAKQGLAAFFDELDYRVFYQTSYGPELLFPVRWDRPLNGNLVALPREAPPPPGPLHPVAAAGRAC